MSFKDALVAFFAEERYRAENKLSDLSYLYSVAAQNTAPENEILLTGVAEMVHEAENQYIDTSSEYARQLAYSGEQDCCATEGMYVYVGDTIVTL